MHVKTRAYFRNICEDRNNIQIKTFLVYTRNYKGRKGESLTSKSGPWSNSRGFLVPQASTR